MAGRKTASPVGVVLQRWRKRAALTQWQLGLKVGLTEWQISRWEHAPLTFFQGKRDGVLGWARACGIDPETSEEVQRFLIATGNGPLLPPTLDAVNTVARSAVQTWEGLISSAPGPLAETDKRAIRRQIRALVRSKPTARHPRNPKDKG